MKISIFTPTYNRAYILGNLYSSIKNQTFTELEWIIVDDGSEDNTKSLVNEWCKEGKVDINYIYQENCGKNVAHNLGVTNAKYEYFVCVDSDDYLVAEAIELISKEISYCEGDPSIAGIIAYRGKSAQEVIGNCFPEFINRRSSLGNLYARGFKGDTTLIFKTELLKRHLFPRIIGEKFITESFVYDQIDRYCEFRLLPKILIVCNYLDDGYTKNPFDLFVKNPIGWGLYYNQKAQFSSYFSEKVKNYCRFWSFILIKKDLSSINLKVQPLLLWVSLPLGVVLGVKRKLSFYKYAKSRK